MSRALAPLFALAAVAGCARNFAGGTTPTGEPLAYDWTTFRQGKAPIDEHDFYRIAEDRDAVSEIEHARDRGVFYNRAGIILAAVGVAALGLATTSDSPGLRRAGYGFMLALPIGGTMAFYGKRKAEKRPVLGGGRARQTAARYNAGIGGAP